MTRRALPSDPLELLRETAEASPPDGAFARVAARLANLPVAAPITATAAPGLTGRPSLGALGRRFLRWSVAPLGLGILIGAGGQALLAGPHPPTPAAAPTSPVPPPVVVPPAVANEPTLPAEPASMSPRPSAPPPRNTLTDERVLLDQARRQLASDEPARALIYLDQHAQRFTRGLLSEEREAMRINVLVQLGRKDEAKARGEAFAARFPNSIMGSGVRAALKSADAAN
jgi:hypothetical protein